MKTKVHGRMDDTQGPPVEKVVQWNRGFPLASHERLSDPQDSVPHPLKTDPVIFEHHVLADDDASFGENCRDCSLCPSFENWAQYAVQKEGARQQQQQGRQPAGNARWVAWQMLLIHSVR